MNVFKADSSRIMIKLLKKGQQITTDDKVPWLYFDGMSFIHFINRNRTILGFVGFIVCVVIKLLYNDLHGDG